jgi:hypothetical protein
LLPDFLLQNTERDRPVKKVSIHHFTGFLLKKHNLQLKTMTSGGRIGRFCAMLGEWDSHGDISTKTFLYGTIIPGDSVLI